MGNDERYAVQEVRSNLEAVTVAIYNALDNAKALPRTDLTESLIDLLTEVDRKTDDALFVVDDIEEIPAVPSK